MLLDSLERAPIRDRIIDQAVRQRREVPPRLLEPPPEVHAGYELYMLAFWDLCRARDRIPWSEVQLWCVTYGITGPDAEEVHFVVSKLDAAYQQWAGKKQRGKPDKGPLGQDAQKFKRRERVLGRKGT